MSSSNKRLGFIGLVCIAFACGPRSTFKHAEEYVQRGRYQQAIETLRTYYLDNPYSENSAEALFRIGNIYRLNLKDFNKASEAYRVLTNRFPNVDFARQAQITLASLYAEQFNDHDRAIVEYQRIATGKGFSNAERAQARMATGIAYYNQGSFQQARIEFEGIREMMPEALQAKVATLKLAQAYDADGGYDNALAYYKQVSQFVVSNNAKTNEEIKLREQLQDLVQQGKFGYAACLEELSHHQEALTAFREILETYPNRRIVEIRIERLSQRMNKAAP